MRNNNRNIILLDSVSLIDSLKSFIVYYILIMLQLYLHISLAIRLDVSQMTSDIFYHLSSNISLS